MNNINIKITDSWAKITFSKPPLNIFSIEDLIFLDKTLQELKNQKTLRMIIFESDQQIFSAGVDIADHLPEKAPELIKAFHKLIFTMIDLEIPTLALVKSGCFGGGSEFALFCDFVLASENAFFAQPEIKLACFPPLSITHLTYLTGNKKALELILTGEKLLSKDALAAGLVNHVFSEEEFDKKTDEFINSIIQNSSSVIRTTLNTYKKINYAGLKEKIEFAEKVFLEELLKLHDYAEGTNSFIEKRVPVWKDC
ncbi:MAG: enoyl-CoA hydratase/isomerase family protein [bacterium]